MAPRTTPTLKPLQLSLLLLVSSWFLHLPGCGATLYTCVIYGNNVPSSAQELIDVDARSLLRKLKDYEGEGFVAVEAGDSDRRLWGRDLETGEAMKQEEDEEDEEDDNEEETTRRLIDCPNSCSNSGSNYCRALGCAYCGACNRRERDLQTFSMLRGRGGRGLSSAHSVEVAMNHELAGYCQGISGCSLWSKIFVVNEDGSLSPAW